MTVADYLKEAVVQYQSGNMRAADEVLSELLRVDPSNHTSLFMKGVIARRSGNIRAAVDLFAQAVSIHPDSDQYYCYLGDTLMDASRTDEAITSYQKATSLRKSYSQVDIYPELLEYLEKDPNEESGVIKGPFCCFSFPKCGTHLLSDIVQKITGYSCFWPETTELTTELMEQVGENEFLTGHFRGDPRCFEFMKRNNYRIIANYRDPRDLLISFYFYYTEILNNGKNKWGSLLRSFRKDQAIDVLMSTLLAGGIAHPSNLANMLNSLLEFKRHGIPVMFITYEEMVRQKLDSVCRIAEFLGFDPGIERAVEIVEETAFNRRSLTKRKKGEPDSSIKRKGVAGDWRNHFTQSNIEMFNSIAGRLLDQLGYEKS